MTGPWQVSEFRNGFVHMNVHVDAEYVGDLTFRRDVEIALAHHRPVPRPRSRAPPTELAMPAEMRPRATSSLRVLHVLEPAIAGVPAYVEKLGRELSDRGVEQVVLTSDRQTWEFAHWPRKVIRRPWKRTPCDSGRWRLTSARSSSTSASTSSTPTRPSPGSRPVSARFRCRSSTSRTGGVTSRSGDGASPAWCARWSGG
ncbi:MAG: hypothetical protein R2695_07530 [Acidimicrobiales bacterium]